MIGSNEWSLDYGAILGMSTEEIEALTRYAVNHGWCIGLLDSVLERHASHMTEKAHQKSIRADELAMQSATMLIEVAKMRAAMADGLIGAP